MQCCALKQRAVTVLSLYLQSASPYPRKTGMEARDLGRVRLHTTGLDFVNHGTNVGFDMPTITMYRYEDGKYKKLWSEGDYRNSEAVDTIQSIFHDSGYLAKGGNPVCKYRYFMSGMFYPTD